MADQGSSTASSPSRATHEPSIAFSIAPTKKDAADLVQQQTLPGNLSLHFNQSQMTLALAIQRSKPAGSSADEYFAQLQKHRKTGKLDLVSNHRYIDTSEFWKDQFDKIYQEKRDLERKLHLLEERQRQHDKLPLRNLYQGSSTANQRKRPAEHQEIGEQLQRQRIGPTDSGQDILLTLGSYIVRIARHCESITNHTKNCNLPIDIEYLTDSCITSTVLLEASVSDCSGPLWHLKCNADRQLLALVEQLMVQVTRCFEACFNGLDKLCSTILGRKNRFDIVARMISFFAKALDYLHNLCSIQEEHELESRRQQGRSSSMEGEAIDTATPGHPIKKGRGDGDEIEVEDGEDYAFNKYLTKAVESMICMQWKVGQPGHKDLLEGMMFFILEHIGRLVSNAVFNEHVSMSDRPGNITKDGPTIFLKASKLEARYMIEILAASLAESSVKRDLIAQVLSDDPMNLHRTSGYAGDVLVRAREKIQCSLLRSVVGEGVPDGLTFPKPSIPEPGINGLSTTADNIMEKYGTEWLLASVWALVGWEMMTP